MTKRNQLDRGRLRVTWSDRIVLWTRAVQCTELDRRERVVAFLIGLTASRNSGKFHAEQLAEKAREVGVAVTPETVAAGLGQLVKLGHLRQIGKGTAYILHASNWGEGKDPNFYEADVARLLGDVIEGYERHFELTREFAQAVGADDDIEAAGLSLQMIESFSTNLAPAMASYKKFAALLLGPDGIAE